MPELYESEDFIYNRIPIRIFNHCFDGVEIFTPAHWHRNIEFNLVTRGRIRRIVDGIQYDQKEGDFFVVNSGELHADHWMEETDHFEGITVQISKSFMELWLGKDFYLTNPENQEHMQQMTDILLQFGALKQRKNQESSQEVYTGFGEKPDGNIENDLSRIRAMELLFRMMGILRSFCMETRSENKRNKEVINKIKDIVNYIDEHYAENLTLAEVAEQFHYTSAHLSRLFKKQIGTNFHDHLQYIRLMNCVEIMKTHPQMQLTSIALDNGFPNMKSFIETFKRFYGCTPPVWMKKKS